MPVSCSTLGSIFTGWTGSVTLRFLGLMSFGASFIFLPPLRGGGGGGGAMAMPSSRLGGSSFRITQKEWTASAVNAIAWPATDTVNRIVAHVMRFWVLARSKFSNIVNSREAAQPPA